MDALLRKAARVRRMVDEVVRACVCGRCENLRYVETKGWETEEKRRWDCGEEDTWGRGTLPHPEQPPPPVAMQLCAGRGCDNQPAPIHGGTNALRAVRNGQLIR